VIAHIAADNVQSIRVAEKLGMRFDGDVDFYGETSRLYVIDRP
jgi:RimJ/RimL family protein N-acetyltransferase